MVQTVVSRSPITFFALVFALTTPFYLLGTVTTLQIIPGVPVSGFAFVCPVTAALILVWLANKKPGVLALLKRSVDWSRIKAKIWLVPVVLLEPFVALVQFAIIQWTLVPIPAPQSPSAVTLVLALALFIGALCEELGWSGYALDPMQDRLGALQASILLGAVWAIWHIIPLVQVGRSPEWIAWWCLGTVAARVLMVWLYNNTGRSVFAVAVFHAMLNLSWQLFPISGSFFDQRINAVLMALAAFSVVVVWGPRKLTRSRGAS